MRSPGKRMRSYLLVFSCTFLLNFVALGQGSVITNVKAALKTGSSKELVKYLGPSLDLNLDGEKANYSKTQAEFVFKDFFKKFVPVDFQYIHQGASKDKEGLRYAIGKYVYSEGSFRVLILFKHKDGIYFADTIQFTKE